MKLHWKLLLCVILFLSKSYGQSDRAFIRYLSQEELRNEHLTYLQLLSLSSDSSHYLFARYHLQYKEDSLFFIHFDQSKALFNEDTLALNYACNYFLEHPSDHYRNMWFVRADSIILPELSRYHLFCYRSGTSPEASFRSLLPEKLQTDYDQVTRYAKKRPWLAASLAVIPGMGQLYLGKYKSFLVEFVSLTISGLQLAESASREGFTHPLSIINTGFTAAFYTSGIVGAFRDAKTLKKDTQRQFYLNASLYYRNHGSYLLY
jgi:hypothetical protein